MHARQTNAKNLSVPLVCMSIVIPCSTFSSNVREMVRATVTASYMIPPDMHLTITR